MKIDLTGKIAVVTGGAGELGRAISRSLAKCGAHLAINYLSSKEKAESIVAEIKSAGGKAIAIRADVTKQEDVNALQKEVAEKFGDADIIVNNAVIQYKWVNVLEQPVEDY